MRGPAILAIVCANLLGGLSYYWTLLAIETGLTPGTIAALRSILASVLLGGWIAATTGFQLKLTKREWIRLAVVGVIATGLPLVLGIVGTAWSTPGNASILILIEPAAILFFSWWLLGEPIRRVQWLGLLVGIAGAYLVVRGNITGWASLQPAELLSGEHARGNLVLLLHGVLWGIYSPAMRPLAEKHRSVDLTFMVMVLALLPTAPFILYESRTWQPIENVGEAIGYVVLLGVVVSVIATVLWNYSLRHLRASTVAIFVFLQPLVGCFCDVVLLGQPLTNGAIYGGSLIVVAVLLVIAIPRRPAPPAEPAT